MAVEARARRVQADHDAPGGQTQGQRRKGWEERFGWEKEEGKKEIGALEMGEEPGVGLEAVQPEGGAEGLRSLLRQRLAVGGVGSGREGEVAVGEHALGEVVVVGVSSDAEVTEHGVRFPAAEEVDDVGVDVGAEEGSGSAGAEAASAEETRVDSSGDLQVGGCQAQGSGDVCRLDGARVVGTRPVSVERSAGVVGVVEDVAADPCQGFARASDGVGRGGVADLFTAHGILLVGESEVGSRDLVIQRNVHGGHKTGAGRVGDCESDVAQAEGFRTAFGFGNS